MDVHFTRDSLIPHPVHGAASLLLGTLIYAFYPELNGWNQTEAAIVPSQPILQLPDAAETTTEPAPILPASLEASWSDYLFYLAFTILFVSLTWLTLCTSRYGAASLGLRPQGEFDSGSEDGFDDMIDDNLDDLSIAYELLPILLAYALKSGVKIDTLCEKLREMSADFSTQPDELKSLRSQLLESQSRCFESFQKVKQLELERSALESRVPDLNREATVLRSQNQHHHEKSQEQARQTPEYTTTLKLEQERASQRNPIKSPVPRSSSRNREATIMSMRIENASLRKEVSDLKAKLVSPRQARSDISHREVLVADRERYFEAEKQAYGEYMRVNQQRLSDRYWRQQVQELEEKYKPKSSQRSRSLPTENCRSSISNVQTPADQMSEADLRQTTRAPSPAFQKSKSSRSSARQKVNISSAPELPEKREFQKDFMSDVVATMNEGKVETSALNPSGVYARVQFAVDFPDDCWMTIETSGRDAQCGIHALVASIKAQFPDILPPPSFEEFKRIVDHNIPYREEVTSLDSDTENWHSPQQLSAMLHAFSEKRQLQSTYGYDIRLGVKRDKAYGWVHDEENVDRRIVWIHHRSHPVPHFSGIRLVPNANLTVRLGSALEHGTRLREDNLLPLAQGPLEPNTDSINVLESSDILKGEIQQPSHKEETQEQPVPPKASATAASTLPPTHAHKINTKTESEVGETMPDTDEDDCSNQKSQRALSIKYTDIERVSPISPKSLREENSYPPKSASTSLEPSKSEADNPVSSRTTVGCLPKENPTSTLSHKVGESTMSSTDSSVDNETSPTTPKGSYSDSPPAETLLETLGDISPDREVHKPRGRRTSFSRHPSLVPTRLQMRSKMLAQTLAQNQTDNQLEDQSEEISLLDDSDHESKPSESDTPVAPDPVTPTSPPLSSVSSPLPLPIVRSPPPRTKRRGRNSTDPATSLFIPRQFKRDPQNKTPPINPPPRQNKIEQNKHMNVCLSLNSSSAKV